MVINNSWFLMKMMGKIMILLSLSTMEERSFLTPLIVSITSHEKAEAFIWWKRQRKPTYDMKMKKINNKYILIAIGIFLFICINIPYETSVPFNDTEFYTVEEPYTDFNYYNYTVIEPYIEYVILDHVVLEAQYMNYVSSPPSYLWVLLKNTDTKSGTFKVDFHISTKDEAIPLIKTISTPEYYISSGETQTVKVSINETIKEFKYDIIPSTKE